MYQIAYFIKNNDFIKIIQFSLIADSWTVLRQKLPRRIQLNQNERSLAVQVCPPYVVYISQRCRTQMLRFTLQYNEDTANQKFCNLIGSNH